MADLFDVALLDWNVPYAVTTSPVDCCRRQGDIERYAVVFCGERLQVGTDLVGDIAGSSGAVRAGYDDIDIVMLHQVATRIVDNQGMRNTALGKFPCSQLRALVAWSRLVDPDVHVDSLLLCKVNRCGCSSVIDCRERAGVAVRQHIHSTAIFSSGNFFEEFRAMSTNTAANLDVFVADRLRILAYGLDEAFIAICSCQLQYPLHRPAQINGSWPRLQKCLCCRTHCGNRRCRERGKIQAPCRRCANKRGTADIHVGDGSAGVLPRVQVMHLVLVWQQPLVDDLYDRRIVGFEPDGSKSFCCHVAVSLVIKPVHMRRVRHGTSCWQENC